MRLCSLLIPLFLFSAVTGCADGEHEDIKRWMAEASRDLKGRVKPLPELKPFPIVSYEAETEADPFSPGRIEPEKKPSGGKQPDFERPREPLENFPLETLQFVGVVTKGKDKSRHALIQADGVVYPVRLGNYMGQNFGRVIEINDKELILVETVQDPTGKTSDWVERRTTLQLQEGAKSKEAGK